MSRLLQYFSICLPGSINHSNYNPLFAEVRDASSIAADYLISGKHAIIVTVCYQGYELS